MQETHRSISSYHRSKLVQSQTSKQALSRQRTTSDQNRQAARGTPAQNVTQGRLSVRSSGRLALHESQDTSTDVLTRSGTRDAPGLSSSSERPASPRSGSGRSPRMAAASRRERADSGDTSFSGRLPNLTAEPRVTTRTQLNSSYQTVDVQPGQRVRIVIDGQGVYVDA